ncbi:hypothetical protein ACTQ49_09390 [Luteococcus sp. Sow4_B9]|uniref:hypothetical protein n=1 Tax=Luteococcus sp. Sow4_B9 TaxID=3438792 RepID=UPI003F9A2B88
MATPSAQFTAPGPRHVMPRHVIQSLCAWGLVPLLATLTLFDLRRDIHGEHGVLSLELLLYGAITCLTLPILWRRRHDVNGPARVLLASFALFIAWGLGTIVRPWTDAAWALHVEPRYRAVPLLQAALVCSAAWGLVLAMGRRRSIEALWWGAVSIIVCTPFAWWRAVRNGEVHRLSTAMGGAAVIHVGLLLCAGIFLDAMVNGRRRMASAVLATVSVALAVASGSRAGLLTLGLAVALLVLWSARAGDARRVLVGSGGLAVLLVLVSQVVPTSRRLFSLMDERRWENIVASSRILRSGFSEVVIGVGAGRVWPWLAFETGRLHKNWLGQRSTSVGHLLTNPHSIFLSAIVELGLVGLILLVVMFVTLVLTVVRGWQQAGRVSQMPRIVLVATILSFFLDTYLIKNFAVSFLWWLVLATHLGTSDPEGPSSTGRRSVLGDEEEPAPQSPSRP